MKRYADTGRLASDMASLPALDREELIKKWRALYGTKPPNRVRESFLIRVIAHRMQEQAMGGLNPATRRFLEKAAEETHTGRRIPTPPAAVKPGTRLLREWHGVTHEVLVLENGVQCNNTQYRSLSEVARAITGTRWSGPLFFCLRKKSEGQTL